MSNGNPSVPMRDRGRHDIAGVVREIASHGNNVEQTLRAITRWAIKVVPGADNAGVTLVAGRGRVASRAQTSILSQRVDQLQERLDQGPCLDAARDGETILVKDLGRDARWPRLAAAASGCRVNSILSLSLNGRSYRGALNLHAGLPSAFTAESIATGEMLANHAAIALDAAIAEERLRFALSNRDVIGQAKGMLMERYHLDAVHAFNLLVRLSQSQNRRLVDVARTLTQPQSVNKS